MRLLQCALLSVCLFAACLCCAWSAQIDWEIATSQKVEKPPDSVRLEYGLGNNEAQRYDVTVAGEGVMKLPGQERQSKLQTNSELTFVDQVLSSNPADGFWRIRRTLKTGTMTITDYGKMPVFVPTIEIEMDKHGAVRTVKGLDKLSSTPGLPTDKGMAEILSQLRSLGFPSKELRVNDKWDQDYTVQVAGQKPITIKTTSTLTGFDRVEKTDCATIVTTYEAPFSLSLDAIDEKTTTPAAKSRALVGKEKGEFRTHFSYGDGKIMESFGSIELTADLETGGKTVEQKPSEPAPLAGAASTEKPKHDLDVKYYVTSLLNPQPVKDAKPIQRARTQ